jgi:site-specific recombinase XerD
LVEDLDLDLDVIPVVGKSGRYRSVLFGAKAGQALERYLRVRRRHRFAHRPELWLGSKGPADRRRDPSDAGSPPP